MYLLPLTVYVFVLFYNCITSIFNEIYYTYAFILGLGSRHTNVIDQTYGRTDVIIDNNQLSLHGWPYVPLNIIKYIVKI